MLGHVRKESLLYKNVRTELMMLCLTALLLVGKTVITPFSTKEHSSVQSEKLCKVNIISFKLNFGGGGGSSGTVRIFRFKLVRRKCFSFDSEINLVLLILK